MTKAYPPRNTLVAKAGADRATNRTIRPRHATAHQHRPLLTSPSVFPGVRAGVERTEPRQVREVERRFDRACRAAAASLAPFVLPVDNWASRLVTATARCAAGDDTMVSPQSRGGCPRSPPSPQQKVMGPTRLRGTGRRGTSLEGVLRRQLRLCERRAWQKRREGWTTSRSESHQERRVRFVLCSVAAWSSKKMNNALRKAATPVITSP